MADTDKLRAEYEQAVSDAQALMAEKDAALQDLRDRYVDDLRAANERAAVAQKRYSDAAVAEALLERPDGVDVAHRLGLELPE